MVLLAMIPKIRISRFLSKHSLGHRIPSTDAGHSDKDTNPEYRDHFEDRFDSADNDNSDGAPYSRRSPNTPANPLSTTYEHYQNSIEKIQKSLPEEFRLRYS